MEKKLIIPLLLIIFSMGSCGDMIDHPKETTLKYMEVVVKDSCEYLLFNAGGNNALFTHKGNCKFCQKRGAIHDTIYITTKPQ